MHTNHFNNMFGTSLIFYFKRKEKYLPFTFTWVCLLNDIFGVFKEAL